MSRPPRGSWRATCEGARPSVSCTASVPRSVDVDARHQLAVGEHDAGDSRSASGALLLIAPQGIIGHAGVARDLDTALQRALGGLRRQGGGPWFGCIHSSQPAASTTGPARP